MKAITIAVSILLSLTFSVSAFAMAGLSLISDGKTVTVQASNFDNVSAVTVVVNYDASAVSIVGVTQGAFVTGAMFASNAKEPGTVTIAVITTQGLSGAGPIATISYQRKGSGAPNFTINRPKSTIIDRNLATQALTTSDTPDTTRSSNNQNTETQGTTGTQGTPSAPAYQGSGSGTTTSTVGGTVTMPPDLLNQPEEKKAQQPPSEYKEEPQREARPVPKETPSPEAKNQETVAKAPELHIVPPADVLARFKAYKGQMSSKALVALFTPDEKATVKQEPAILLADGKANLKVTIQNPQGRQAPNFALKKAKLVNLKMNSDSAWIVVARPVKDTYEASVTMLVDDASVDIPLVVAPKVDVDLDKSGTVDEKDFTLFLKERGSDKAPKFDLNKDGRRDYVDDYIFTANFLAQQQKTKEKTETGKGPDKSAGTKQQAVPAEKSQKQ